MVHENLRPLSQGEPDVAVASAARRGDPVRYWQVFGRYVLNDTPTWAESLALLLVLYMTMLGVAVGVRDAGHIGLESLPCCCPDWLRLSWTS